LSTTTTRLPETPDEAREWQRRYRDYLRSGVGAATCTGLDCAGSGAYLSGSGYGDSPDACPPCAALMSTWSTRPVGGTGFRHVPRGGLPVAPVEWQVGFPGVAVPEQRSATSTAPVAL
jgi:hypothetical protein